MGGRSGSFNSKNFHRGGGINLGALPDLQGSEKQIKWAEDIRREWKKQIDEFNQLSPKEQYEVLLGRPIGGQNSLKSLLASKVKKDSYDADDWLDNHGFSYSDKAKIKSDPVASDYLKRAQTETLRELRRSKQESNEQKMARAKSYIKRAITTSDASELIDNRMREGAVSPKEFTSKFKKAGYTFSIDK